MERDTRQWCKGAWQSLWSPYILLLGISLGLLSLLILFSVHLDRYASSRDRQLLHSLVAENQAALAAIAVDWGYWNDAVENLLIAPDPKWIESNMLSYLQESFAVDRSAVLDTSGRVVLSIANGEIEQKAPAALVEPSLNRWLRGVLSWSSGQPRAMTTVASINDRIYLLAVAPLTPDEPADGLELGKGYGMLVFARELSRQRLDQWSEAYGLSSLRLYKERTAVSRKSSALSLDGLDGDPVGYLVFEPSAPGSKLLLRLLPWGGPAFVALFALSLFLLLRDNRRKKTTGRALLALQRSRKQLRASQRLLQNVIDGAGLGYWEWQYQTGQYRVNRRWLEMLGLQPSDITNRIEDWSTRIHPDDRARMEKLVEKSIADARNYVGEFRMRHKDGHWVWIQGAGAVVEYRDGRPWRLCGTHQEIGERKQKEERLQRAASHDHLTGLHNRQSLERRFAEELARAQRYGQLFALFLLDIDHFKPVNDRYGHLAGDRVLKSLAEALQEHVREVDFVARYGGEEFVLIMPETGPEEALEMGERLRAQIEGLLLPAGCGVEGITISVGIASYPLDGQSYQELMFHADSALYEAKESGRNCVRHALNMDREELGGG